MDEFVTVTLTCHTPGCENADIPVTMDCPVGSLKICGPCGQEITDVV